MSVFAREIFLQHFDDFSSLVWLQLKWNIENNKYGSVAKKNKSNTSFKGGKINWSLFLHVLKSNIKVAEIEEMLQLTHYIDLSYSFWFWRTLVIWIWYSRGFQHCFDFAPQAQ